VVKCYGVELAQSACQISGYSRAIRDGSSAVVAHDVGTVAINPFAIS
jgi:hypothetical protein